LNKATSASKEARPTITAQAFTDALSKAANGVSIVTTGGADGRAGLTVSSMCSVCADPALVLACVNADNEFCALADGYGHFAINLLTTEQTAVSQVFAGLDEHPEENRFNTGEWTTLVTGSPVLDGALVALDCELESSTTHGSHRIYIGRVLGVASTQATPLVYCDRGYVQTTPIDTQ